MPNDADGTFADLAILLITAGLLALAMRAIYLARFAFIVRIANGELRLKKGKITQAFRHEIRELCAEHGVRNGWVRGAWQGRRITLVFSNSIPPPCQQRLRNTWALRA
jgi:hypothetical protein